MSFLAVLYTKGTITSTTTNLTTQSQLLAQSVLETYYDLNALNTAGVCDAQYHSLNSIQVVSAITGDGRALGAGSSQHRHLSGASDPNYIYQVQGSCRGCPTSTPMYVQ